jgi:hypothetical protein
MNTTATKYQRPFHRGDRVTFKDGSKGTLTSEPEKGAMGWAQFQAYSGACFTVSTAPNSSEMSYEVTHTK